MYVPSLPPISYEEVKRSETIPNTIHLHAMQGVFGPSLVERLQTYKVSQLIKGLFKLKELNIVNY